MTIAPGGEFAGTLVVVARVRMASEVLRTRTELPLSVPVSVGPGVIVASPVVGLGFSVERTRTDSVAVESAGKEGQYGQRAQ